MSAVEKFPILLSEAEEESSAVPPCFSDEGINVRLSHRHAKAAISLALFEMYSSIAIKCRHSPRREYLST